MMKYRLILRGPGDGCDYTIGCNCKVIEIEAGSLDDLMRQVRKAWEEYEAPDGPEYYKDPTQQELYWASAELTVPITIQAKYACTACGGPEAPADCPTCKGTRYIPTGHVGDTEPCPKCNVQCPKCGKPGAVMADHSMMDIIQQWRADYAAKKAALDQGASEAAERAELKRLLAKHGNPT